MAGPLAGRGAVVTGGTRGIGRAVADRLAAGGARVGVLDLDLDPASPHEGWQADVADAAAVSAAIAEAADRFGGLAILVNNAGFGTAKALHRYGDDEWARMVGVNLTGAWHAMRAALPHLRASGAGCIVSIAGTTASRPTRGEGPYAAAKAGLVALTKTAAVEYGPEVRVNAVSPGYIATRLTRAVVDDEKLRARVEGRIPLGRIGTVDDVAGVVAFLCGPDAAYLTGQDIIVDGGSILPSHQSDDLLKALLSREEP